MKERETLCVSGRDFAMASSDARKQNVTYMLHLEKQYLKRRISSLFKDDERNQTKSTSSKRISCRNKKYMKPRIKLKRRHTAAYIQKNNCIYLKVAETGRAIIKGGKGEGKTAYRR